MPFSTETPTFPNKSRVWGQTLCDQMPLSSCSMILDLSYLNLLIYEMGMIIIYFIKIFKKLNEMIHVKLAATCLVHNKQSMNASCHFMHIYVCAYMMSMTFYFLPILTYIFVIIIENITGKPIPSKLSW